MGAAIVEAGGLAPFVGLLRSPFVGARETACSTIASMVGLTDELTEQLVSAIESFNASFAAEHEAVGASA